MTAVFFFGRRRLIGCAASIGSLILFTAHGGPNRAAQRRFDAALKGLFFLCSAIAILTTAVLFSLIFEAFRFFSADQSHRFSVRPALGPANRTTRRSGGPKRVFRCRSSVCRNLADHLDFYGGGGADWTHVSHIFGRICFAASQILGKTSA